MQTQRMIGPRCGSAFFRVVPIAACDNDAVRRIFVLIAFILDVVFRRCHFAQDFGVLEVQCLHSRR